MPRVHAATAPAAAGLPDFTVEALEALLVRLREHGYALLPVSELASQAGGLRAFVRHDIDLHVSGIERVAEAEAELGVAATYYIALTQPYNPASPPNRAVLRRVVELGHEVGLHYDLAEYPPEPRAAEESLRRAVAYLAELVGVPVRTISTHEPHRGQPDPFLDIDGLLHPHSPRLGEDVVYVSDSCRAWRDDTLLRCFAPDPPATVMLNMHPEVWLGGADVSRDAFVAETLLPTALADQRRYYGEVIPALWADYPRREPAP